MESRETRERVYRQFNWIEISTQMLINDEEQVYLKGGFFIVTVRSFRSTVTMERFIMDRFK